MTKLSDQIIAMETENETLQAQVKSLEAQIERQKGALLESRGENASKDRQISRLQTKVDGYENYFRSLHHGLTDLKAQTKNATEAARSPAPAAITSKASPRLMERIEAIAMPRFLSGNGRAA